MRERERTGKRVIERKSQTDRQTNDFTYFQTDLTSHPHGALTETTISGQGVSGSNGNK